MDASIKHMVASAQRVPRSILAGLLAAVVALPAFGSTAYVSVHGTDTLPTGVSNKCSAALPCRTITHALTTVTAGSTVQITASGTYDTFTAAMSITVQADPGVNATINVPPPAATGGGDGIVVNGGGVKVTIRGLQINGIGGVNGINFIAGASLRVQDCDLANMSNSGIQLTATNASVFIEGVSVHDNTQAGILLSGVQTASLDRVRADANGYGVYAAGGAVVDIRNSSAADNQWSGFNLDASTAAGTTMTVSKSASLRNVYGIAIYVLSPYQGYLTVDGSLIEGNHNFAITDLTSSGGGTLTVTDSKISRNGNGVWYNNGTNAARVGVLARNVLDQNGFAGVYLGGSNTVVTLEANVVTGHTAGVAFGSAPTATGPVAYSRGDNTFSGNGANVIEGSLTPLSGL